MQKENFATMDGAQIIFLGGWQFGSMEMFYVLLSKMNDLQLFC